MDIYSMIESGAHFKVEASAEDLIRFADHLIDKARELDSKRVVQLQEQNRWLSAKETCELCNVCPSTLWAWAKAGYLVPTKVGRTRRFSLADVQRVLNNKGNPDINP